MKKKSAGSTNTAREFSGRTISAPTVPVPQQQQQLSIEQALALASQHSDAGRLPQAEELLKKILQAQPRNAPALHMLGIVAYRAGNTQAAADLVGRAIAIDNKTAIYHANRAEMCRLLERIDEAIEHGRKAVALDPRMLAAQGNLGVAYFDRKEYDKAEACHKAALAINPNFASSLNNMGSIMRERKEYEAAIDWYRRAANANPQYLEPLNNLGATLTQMDKAQEAIVILQDAIKRNPRYPESHCNIGFALLALEKHQPALNAFETALHLRPDYPEAYQGIARLWKELNEFEKAEQAARKSLELDPEMVEGYATLGSIYISMGYPDRAKELFERALKLDPENSSGIMGLGNIYVEEGKFKEAEALFSKVVDTPTERAGALFSIVQTKKIKPGDELIAALEAEAKDIDKLPESKAMYLHFALGKVYDDIGDSDHAFPHFMAGCALKRKKLVYDANERDDNFKRIAQVFSREFIEKNRGHGDSSDLPIFVLGMPRSGTTLTEQIIASHPDVFGAGELFDLINLVHRKQDPKAPDFPESVKNLNFAEIGRKYVDGLRVRDAKAKHITDKMPVNFMHVGLIYLALPGAKIVHVNRNPLDTCISCYTRLFAHNQNQTYELNELGRYYRAYNTLMKHWREVLPKDSFYDLQYEALVDNTEEEAKRLIAYCGLEWDDSCLAFHEHKRNVRTASVHQVRQPIYKTSVARWKKYEKFLGPLIDGLGDAFVAE